jgi:predicted DNA-binding transcriptional regulator AlpA
MLPDFDALALPVAQIPAALAELAAWQAQLAARLMTAPAASDGHGAPELRLLGIDEAAAKLGVTPEWLYRRAKRLGLAVKLGDGTLRFSSVALDAYIKSQTIAAVPARRRRS